MLLNMSRVALDNSTFHTRRRCIFFRRNMGILMLLELSIIALSTGLSDMYTFLFYLSDAEKVCPVARDTNGTLPCTIAKNSEWRSESAVVQC